MRRAGGRCLGRPYTLVTRPAINNKQKGQRKSIPMRNMGYYTAPNPVRGGHYTAAKLKRVGPYAPKIVQNGNKIMVTNREIVMQVNGTFTAGTAPAGAFQRSFGFRNAADTGTGLLGNNTWLGRIAGCYDKFRPIKAILEFVPSVAFTYSGQTAIVYDPDPNPTVAPSFTNSVSGNRYVSTSQLSQPNRMVLPRDCFNRLPWYDTSSAATDLDVTSAGTVYFVNTLITSPLAAQANAMSFGAVWMEYTVEFDVPSNPGSATTFSNFTQTSADLPPLSVATIVDHLADNVATFEKEMEEEAALFPSLKAEFSAATAPMLALAAALSKTASGAKSRRRKSPGLP